MGVFAAAGRPILVRGEIQAACPAEALARSKGPQRDPVNMQDLVAFPADVADIVCRRLASGTSPKQPSAYVWPKDRSTGRVMTQLDPFDATIFRATVGRYVGPIEREVDRERALAAVPRGRRPYWVLEHHFPAIELRQRKAAAWLRSEGSEWLGTIDIRNYFYRVTPTMVRSALSSVVGPTTTKDYLRGWLERVAQMSGAPGLPVGPDPSAVLGNFFLVPADQALSKRCETWIRFMDDIWIFAGGQSTLSALREWHQQYLGRLGLEHNHGKWSERHGIDAVEFISGAGETSSVGDLDKDEPSSGTPTALDRFDLASENPDENRAEFRLSLRELTKLGSDHAVVALQRDPALLASAPDQWHDYLAAIGKGRQGRKRVDPDWALGCVLTPGSGHPDCERLIILNALMRRSMGPKSEGDGLAEVAFGSIFPPAVRATAATCWGLGRSWKFSEAVEAAINEQDFGVKRALVSTLKGKGIGKKLEAAMTRLRQSDPELEPTIKWGSC